MTPEGWALITLVVTAALGWVGLYVRKRLGLADEAKTEVQKAGHSAEPPGDISQAFMVLARRLEHMDQRDEAWTLFAFHLELELHAANALLPAGKRRPFPKRPKILRGDDEEEVDS